MITSLIISYQYSSMNFQSMIQVNQKYNFVHFFLLIELSIYLELPCCLLAENSIYLIIDKLNHLWVFSVTSSLNSVNLDLLHRFLLLMTWDLSKLMEVVGWEWALQNPGPRQKKGRSVRFIAVICPCWNLLRTLFIVVLVNPTFIN